MEILQTVVATLNQVFEAGIAITALSLFIRSLSFNLKDRVSQSFAVILLAVMVVFSGEAITAGAIGQDWGILWLRIQWVGIVILPAGMVHFGDALLATTGRPSRGRRRRVVHLGYIISIMFVAFLLSNKLVGDVLTPEVSFPHLSQGPLFGWFTAYYILAMIVASWWIWRAQSRTRLPVNRQRIANLLFGAVLLALGTFPYLQFGSGIAQRNPLVFLTAVTLGNLLIFWILVLMAYAVAFFGLPWPDRVVRSRLLKWLLRGPVAIFIVLALMTGVYRVGELFNAPYSVAIPVITVTTILVVEHLITLIYPFVERWFFYGGDREAIRLLQSVGESLVTTGDLEQFLEAVLASACDLFQVSTAFVAALGEEKLERVVQFGDREALNKSGLEQALVERVEGLENGTGPHLFAWDEFWAMPLYGGPENDMIGLLGVLRRPDHNLEEGLAEGLSALGERAALALENRNVQKEVLQALSRLSQNVNRIQRLRAATRFDQADMLMEIEEENPSVELNQWVKDALSHYWGGPKLTESPLIRLQIVQTAIEEHGSPANALRAVLKQGVEQVRPVGERRFTAEWILYNILEMKFMQGRKVKDIALRLAMSEADLYRKQRVAIEAVAGAIVAMERSLNNDQNGSSPE